MGIKIQTPVNPEQLVYDNIFMTSIRIDQTESVNSAVPPIYDVFIDYKVYAEGIGNKRYFKNDMHTVNALDYLQAATAKAGLGDTSMLEALVAIEKVVSLLISDKGDIGTTQVTV